MIGFTESKLQQQQTKQKINRVPWDFSMDHFIVVDVSISFYCVENIVISIIVPWHLSVRNNKLIKSHWNR